ncbi:MAG: DeoR/GlpR family DNA-binding transcription regulator [Tractidigestivibacter sp.]|jgi:DeoR family transcriptional regulator of aga operon|uniref:DeoR/GlpR family DNA-binding transcription regulator n=1 Tax=Tractidigestivibacter sp. TaxID=2847320 RepID=UPI003D8EF930
METENHNRMLAAERQKLILDLLHTNGSVSVNEICEKCGVSSVTARSDLDALEREGHLKRTHGGAVPISQLVIPAVPQRVRKNARAKKAIGKRAAELVEDGETILVGSGSTTLAFLHCLGEKHDIKIITNDINGLIYVEQFLPNATPACTGGVLGREYRHFSGPMVASSLSEIYLDKVFLGADGFEPDFGFLAEFEQTASTKVEFIRHARKTVILMDSTKVGTARSFVRFAGPKDADIVIMDKDPGGIVAQATMGPHGQNRVILA